MDFFELVKKRYSVRNFSNQTVEPKKIERILTAARTAPSAGNLKAYRIYQISDANKKKQLVVAAAHQDFIAQSPIVLVFCACPETSARDYGERGAQLYSIQDATIACAYAQLAACELGLGSCWVGSFDESAVRSVLELEQNIVPIALLPVGYEH